MGMEQTKEGGKEGEGEGREEVVDRRIGGREGGMKSRGGEGTGMVEVWSDS